MGRQILLLGALFMLAALLVFGAIALFSGFFGRLLQRSAQAQKMLHRFSSLVFLGLALRLARAGQLAQADARQLDVRFWQGVALQFVNIKAWLLALTIVAGWVLGRSDSLQRLAVVLPVMVCFAFASNFTYAALGALLRGWLAQGRRLLWFNRCMALVLALTAAWMLRA